MNLWTIVLVVVAVIILLITCSHVPDLNNYISSYKNKSLLKYAELSDFIKNCDNGDIILMCGNTRGERSCRWVTNCKFSHVAIIFRETNEKDESIPYVWESDLGCKSKDGPRVMRLYDKLKNYHGYKTLAWRKLKCGSNIIFKDTINQRPTTQDIMGIVREMQDYKFDTSMVKWFTSSGWLKPFHHFFYDETKKFCSELVAETFQKLGIFKDTLDLSSNPACWYSPKNFEDIKIIGLKDSYSFEDEIFVDFFGDFEE